ncbi:MAG: Rrf2 family transcriptional regulator [Deltaproteobacteria bacterium]|nr:Rrf2 family transcriptional regulator [Deltaproteobacteria bacterium]
MKLSTRSRYGLRMLLDMAQHSGDGPVQIGSIAKRQDISVKYLEQLIIPLKKANYIRSIRGPKGGHLLARSPDEITVGEIVDLLEGGVSLASCIEQPGICDRHGDCVTRAIWEEATRAMHERLDVITLAEMMKRTVRESVGGKPKKATGAIRKRRPRKP